MTWWIAPILMVAVWVYFKIKRLVNHKSIIGKQIMVNYFDQNIGFETIFPLIGTVTEKIKANSERFFIVCFDQSFHYQNNGFDKIIIKERHTGKYIGADGEIHVHVYLPTKDLPKTHYERADFVPVAWAIIKNI